MISGAACQAASEAPEQGTIDADVLVRAEHYPIAFVSNLGALPPQVHVMREDGSEVRQVTDDSLGYQHPVWSPEGSTLAAMALQSAGGRFDIVLVSPSDGSSTRLTPDTPDNEAHPSWSADGQRIAYASTGDDGIERIWLMSRSGGQIRRLIPGLQEPHGAPQWSWCDSSRLAFSATDPNGVQDLWSVDPEHPELRTNLSRGRALRPRLASWAPDGARLAFISAARADSANLRLYVLELASDELTLIAEDNFIEARPAWSPDGRFLLVAREVATDDGAQYLIRASDGLSRGALSVELWLVPVDDPGAARALSRRPDSFDGFGSWYAAPAEPNP